jgi:hypothetical protein
LYAKRKTLHLIVSICVKNVTKRKKRIMCTAPRIEDLDLKDVDTVAIDLETYDPNLKKHGSGAIRGDGFVCGIAIATDKQTLYFPIAHAMTENLDKEETWNELNELIFQNEKITKVFHNAMYDVCWIRSATKQMPKGKLIDTMIAASVLDEMVLLREDFLCQIQIYNKYHLKVISVKK